jgi:Uma2 family endonuclease
MGLPAHKPRYSIQDYYRIENDSSAKHEFADGEMLAMAGGSPQHAKIALKFAVQLDLQLKGRPCQPYGSDLRIRIPGRDRTVYPDISVICGEVQLDPDDKAGHSALNPRVVIEVLSPSTEAYDRGAKFADYREISSLLEYVLVSQTAPSIETFFRQENETWAFDSTAGLGASIKLRAVNVDIPLVEIYSGLEFPPESEPSV